MPLSALISATAGEVFKYIGYIIVALLGLMVMIVIHELGHYLAGKALGFKIDEFALGFGPAIFKRTNKKNGEVFSIRPFPIGGFCAFHGEDEEGADDEGAFNKQKPWKRLIVLFSGALFNFLSAILIITIYFTAYGQILPVVQDSFAVNGVENVFQAGDILLSVDGRQINIMTADDVAATFERIGDGSEVKVLRDGKTVKITVTKGDYVLSDEYLEEGEDPNKTGLGIVYGLESAKIGFWRSLGRSFGFSFFIVFKVLASLGALLTGQIGLEAAGGTITVIKTIADVSATGFGGFLYVVAIISANLAVMNLLPIPALDGSRMVFTLIEMIFRKPVPRKIEAVIHAVGLVGIAVAACRFPRHIPSCTRLTVGERNATHFGQPASGREQRR